MNATKMRPQRGTAVKNLFGGRFIEPEAVRHSMRALEARLDARFKERTRRHAEFVDRAKQYHQPLLDLITKGEKRPQSIDGMRRLHEDAQRRATRQPHRETVHERVFAGSIGATVVPAYDYEWTWSGNVGKPGAEFRSGRTDRRRDVDRHLDRLR